MFDNLMSEVEYLKSKGFVPGILEGIMYILDNEEQYASEVRRELKLFMRQGAQLFAPKETV
jgi:hypothetical protein